MERRDVAAHQWNPYLRSGLHCFLLVFQPDFQFLLLHFTFALHLYFSTTSSHSLWSATVNSWLSSSWTLRFGRVEISQPQGTFDYRTTITITITITAVSSGQPSCVEVRSYSSPATATHRHANQTHVKDVPTSSSARQRGPPGGGARLGK